MQTITSKNTSINTTKLPKIYNQINWERFRNKKVFDYGAGCDKTRQLIANFLEQYDVKYYPYDLYNMEKQDNYTSLMMIEECDVYICSNVLNVINSNITIQEIITNIIKHCNGNPYWTLRKPFYFTIYEGNKSGFEKTTKKDCYQKNHSTQWYVDKFFFGDDVKRKNNIITNQIGLQGLKKR